MEWKVRKKIKIGDILIGVCLIALMIIIIVVRTDMDKGKVAESANIIMKSIQFCARYVAISTGILSVMGIDFILKGIYEE